MNYQSNIKELREQKGISQEKLSEDSGVSLRTIQRIENGECTPRESTLINIAESLNVTTDYLIYNPLEVITEYDETKKKTPKKKFKFAWYRLGFFILGASSGVFLGLYCITADIFPEVNEALVGVFMFLFGSVGLIFGNYIEKRNS